jgi:hypothetical protein
MTLFNRSLREPGSWSAAVRRNFSVLVAAGRIVGVVSSKGLEGGATVVTTEGWDEDWSGGGG